jgi:transketolase
MRQSLVKSCEKMLRQGNDSIVLLGDIGVYSFRDLSNQFPTRVLNIGIMEQSMVSVGAGLSSRGITPTIHTIAPFLVERSLEQIKIDFGYQGLAANLVSVGASFDYAALGCTHHCPADMLTLAKIPGMQLFVPGHPKEFEDLFEKNWNSKALNYSERRSPKAKVRTKCSYHCCWTTPQS